MIETDETHLERLINHLALVPCPVENFIVSPPRRLTASSSPLSGTVSTTVLDLLSNDDCIRFLKARNMNFDKSVAMIKAWAVWFTSPLPGSDTTPSEIVKRGDPREDIYTQYLPHSNLGEDKHGRPIYWEKTGLISSRFHKIKTQLTEDEIFVRHVYQQELMRERFLSCSTKRGKTINKQILVFDMKGVSFSPDATAMRLFRRALAIDESCYPETLHRLYMINTPMFFSAIWAVIRPWINHETSEKIHLLGSNYLEHLQEDIDISQIPVEFGGKKENFEWSWPGNLEN